MKLGIDGWRLRTRAGIARVLFNVIRNWTEEFVQGRFDEITLYTPVPLDDDLALPPFVQQRVLGPDMRMLLWQNLVLGRSIRDDVLLCPSYSRPLHTRANTVSIIHEATQKLYPQYYPFLARFIQTPLYGWSARHATRVVTPTCQAKEDIIRAYHAPRDRIRVVPLAASEMFHSHYPQQRLKDVRLQYAGDDVPFFLYVGTLTARRNVPRLVQALATMLNVKDSLHRLVIVGRNSTDLDLGGLASSLGIEERVRYHPFVPDEDLAPLYSAAEAFVLPYSYEALSLTMLESQAAGTPVITVGAPGLREMAGEAGLFIPDVEVITLASAMSRVADDSALRADLTRQGRANAAQYSWQRCASEILNVCNEAAKAEGVARTNRPVLGADNGVIGK